jgi:hypothetical protein
MACLCSLWQTVHAAPIFLAIPKPISGGAIFAKTPMPRKRRTSFVDRYASHMNQLFMAALASKGTLGVTKRTRRAF